MYNPSLSQLAGIATAIMMIISYFFKSKKSYLLCQTLGLCCMFFSYLFGNGYFAMIALTVSLSRTLVFFMYENKNRNAPIYLSFLFAGLTLFAYFLVNYIVLKTARPVDTLYLAAQIMYAYIFRIRNINFVRYSIIVPHCLAILYNLLLDGMMFVALSYTFELLADLYAIFKERRAKKQQKQT